MASDSGLAPGDGVQLTSQQLRFRYSDVFEPLPDAYETLLRDVVQGDQTLFVSAAETEAAWRLYDPVIEERPARCRTGPGAGDRRGPIVSRSRATTRSGIRGDPGLSRSGGGEPRCGAVGRPTGRRGHRGPRKLRARAGRGQHASPTVRADGHRVPRGDPLAAGAHLRGRRAMRRPRGRSQQLWHGPDRAPGSRARPRDTRPQDPGRAGPRTPPPCSS